LLFRAAFITNLPDSSTNTNYTTIPSGYCEYWFFNLLLIPR
jgi:hypothetical protein